MAESPARLLRTLEQATIAALLMSAFSCFILGCGFAAALFERLYDCTGG